VKEEFRSTEQGTQFFGLIARRQTLRAAEAALGDAQP